uniref:Uncharacterized protein n=1 Tax=Quercus lobata TaxID=97700 RepID=A0A7N2LQZ7_QUELO
MRFKDLVKFNEAMLARQVWRLMNDHSSLFYRVFKAKYFPRGSIFEASASSGSYAWQSILKARNVISAGMRRRLGDGKRIKFYNENWHPGNESTKHFLWFETQRIKAIPLCVSRQVDSIIWPRCKNGEYLVKTGYQQLCEDEGAVLVSRFRSLHSMPFRAVKNFTKSGIRSSAGFKKIFQKLSERLNECAWPLTESLKQHVATYRNSSRSFQCTQLSHYRGNRVVVRNANGEVLAALSEKIPYPFSVEVLGVLAARREAQFTVELGIQQSVFERDPEIMCNALKSTDFDHSSIGHLDHGNEFLPSFSLQSISGKRERARSRAREEKNIPVSPMIAGGLRTPGGADLASSSPTPRRSRSTARSHLRKIAPSRDRVVDHDLAFDRDRDRRRDLAKRRSRSRAVARSRSRDASIAILPAPLIAIDGAISRSVNREIAPSPLIARSRRRDRDR